MPNLFSPPRLQFTNSDEWVNWLNLSLARPVLPSGAPVIIDLFADGRRRMLHVREGARLQSFPDWFEFVGTPTEQAEQIGKAVPPLLSLAIAKRA